MRDENRSFFEEEHFEKQFTKFLRGHTFKLHVSKSHNSKVHSSKGHNSKGHTSKGHAFRGHSFAAMVGPYLKNGN